MKLVSTAEMGKIEREADANGLSYEMMMEHAGDGLAEQVASRYADLQDGGVLGLVGSGNNGGDTLVALAKMADWGWKATAYIVRARPENDPLMERLLSSGGEIIDGASSLNEAFLTGESRPVSKEVGDEVIAGAVNGEGVLTTRVTRTGDATTLSQIMRLVEEAQASRSRFPFSTKLMRELHMPRRFFI